MNKAYTVIDNEVCLIDESGESTVLYTKNTPAEAVFKAKAIATTLIPYMPSYMITHRKGRTLEEEKELDSESFKIGENFCKKFYSLNNITPSSLPPKDVTDSLYLWTDVQKLNFCNGWSSYVNLSYSKEAPKTNNNEKDTIDNRFKTVNVLSNRDEIHTVNLDYISKIVSSGILVSLEIGRWRASIALTPEDIGIDSTSTDITEIQDKYLSLGKKNLLPKSYIDQLNSIESSARANLNRYSFSTPWGRFVTEANWIKWKTKNQELKDKYIELGKTIAENSEAIFKEVLNDYVKLAPAVFSRSKAKIKSYPSEEWTENYIRNIRSKFPDKQAILESFYFKNVLMRVPEISNSESASNSEIVNQMIEEFKSEDNFPDLYLSIINQTLFDLSNVLQTSNVAISSGKLSKHGTIHPSTRTSIIDSCNNFLSHILDIDTDSDRLYLKTKVSDFLSYVKSDKFSSEVKISLSKIEDLILEIKNKAGN